jgi:hypothetical protein
MSRLHTSDRGVSLIEFSVLLPLLLVIALGAFEYGMLFRDSLTVSTAAREAGRVAASSADYGEADCVILEAAAGALTSIRNGEIDEVRIYRSDASGSIPDLSSSTLRRYRPAMPSDVSTIACSGSEWFAIHLGSNWDPDDRVNDPRNADWIGVQIQYTHSFTTGFLWFNGTSQLADEAVFRIEPPAPGSN